MFEEYTFEEYTTYESKKERNWDSNKKKGKLNSIGNQIVCSKKVLEWPRARTYFLQTMKVKMLKRKGCNRNRSRSRSPGKQQKKLRERSRSRSRAPSPSALVPVPILQEKWLAGCKCRDAKHEETCMHYYNCACPACDPSSTTSKKDAKKSAPSSTTSEKDAKKGAEETVEETVETLTRRFTTVARWIYENIRLSDEIKVDDEIYEHVECEEDSYEEGYEEDYDPCPCFFGDLQRSKERKAKDKRKNLDFDSALEYTPKIRYTPFYVADTKVESKKVDSEKVDLHLWNQLDQHATRQLRSSYVIPFFTPQEQEKWKSAKFFLVNQKGWNCDHRGKDHIRKQMDPKTCLNRYNLPWKSKQLIPPACTLAQFILLCFQAKTRKYDFWYELFTGANVFQMAENCYFVDLGFDHGS
jgi:hypothetical protein